MQEQNSGTIFVIKRFMTKNMQRRIAVLSNAGGTGKTTLTTHLGYLLGSQGHSVALIDLDPQGSLSLFTGLKKQQTSIASVFDETFQGDWNLAPVSWNNKVSVAYADTGLVKAITQLALHERGAYLLSDRLIDYPLPHKYVFFDCPATLGPLPLVALSAATDILIPIQPEPKAVYGCAALLQWIFQIVKRLRLNPQPKILGVVPCMYNKNFATHRNLLIDLRPTLADMGLEFFPPIRHSADFKTASGKGIPIPLFRPGNSAITDFEPIVKKLNFHE